MKPEGIYEFGKFRIEVLARTLRREEETVTLNRRAFDVLLYLVQNPGRVLNSRRTVEECLARDLRGREQSGAKYLGAAAGTRGETRRQQLYRHPAGARVSVCRASADCCYREPGYRPGCHQPGPAAAPAV